MLEVQVKEIMSCSKYMSLHICSLILVKICILFYDCLMSILFTGKNQIDATLKLNEEQEK